eukprot:TRINITY_DN11740_c0_g1_i1.p1 TRINITY_DN11740_c0_g1~~TRINITY_DN11740_c0_g1_i1.p1  ORF type:complete len:112 (-),score=17.83 TRINITY_DN11740_c0_g1_i1:96-431(-)
MCIRDRYTAENHAKGIAEAQEDLMIGEPSQEGLLCEIVRCDILLELGDEVIDTLSEFHKIAQPNLCLSFLGEESFMQDTAVHFIALLSLWLYCHKYTSILFQPKIGFQNST